MRWDELRLTDDAGGSAAGTVPLLPRGAVTRTFDTPEFAGMTFHEVTCPVGAEQGARRLPDAVPLDGQPLPGLLHGLRLLLRAQDARVPRPRQRRGLRLADRGEDQRRRGAAPRAAPAVVAGEHVAMGTNVDCYQRVEGRYRLMRDDHPGPARRGQPVLDPDQGRADPARPRPAGRRPPRSPTCRRRCRSGSVDRDVWRQVEPGTPPPAPPAGGRRAGSATQASPAGC